MGSVPPVSGGFSERVLNIDSGIKFYHESITLVLIPFMDADSGSDYGGFDEKPKPKPPAPAKKAMPPPPSKATLVPPKPRKSPFPSDHGDIPALKDFKRTLKRFPPGYKVNE